MKLYLPGDAAACAVGADAVALALEIAARDRGIAIEIVRTGSRGLFEMEPLLEVNGPDGRQGFARVAPDEADKVLAAILDGADHASAIGPVEALPFLARQTRLTFARCGITDPQSLDEYRAHGGLKGLEQAIRLGPVATVAEVVASGLRGRGGAGFPAGLKWRTVLETPSPSKYVVCNADEGDSGTFADRMLMEGDPFLLVEGMAIAGLAVGATRGYIYIRSEYPHAIRAMRQAIATARGAGLLGPSLLGSGFAFDIYII
jgi:formate dehydrogenase iron-sulfur subunit